MWVWLQASALSMPCREMCEAVVSTCGCNSQRTLGSLLDAALSDITLVRHHHHLVCDVRQEYEAVQAVHSIAAALSCRTC